jgi:hypothetical protein
MKPVSAFVGVVIPGSGVLLESLPLVEAEEVASVGAIDFSFVEVCPVEVLAELTRQDDVGVEVENPVLAADLVEAAIDHPALVERAAATMVVGQDMVNGVPTTDGSRLFVVRRRDDDQVVDEREIFRQCGREKVPIANTDLDNLNSHFWPCVRWLTGSISL